MLTVAGAMLLSSCAGEPERKQPEVKNEPVAEIRRLDLRGIPFHHLRGIGSLQEPGEASNVESLAKRIPDKESADKVAGLVDFTKESLVMFAWIGCGSDVLGVHAETLRGKRWDLKAHFFCRGAAKAWHPMPLHENVHGHHQHHDHANSQQ